MSRGIETTYAGHLFRSRLEARWAAFFDLIGWQWIYEPFDATGYIPDFLVQPGPVTSTEDMRLPAPLLIEVKPSGTIDDLEAHLPRVIKALEGHWTGDVLFLGASPIMGGAKGWASEPTVAGLIVDCRDGSPWGTDCALWSSSPWGVWAEYGDYRLRPHGGRGDRSLWPTLTELQLLWGQAHKATRWTAKR